LKSSGVDTSFSTAHHLALAQRDSGAIDPALKFFLKGLTIDELVDPARLDFDLGGTFYGNIGRCLHLMGQVEPAIACYRKSARLIEEEDKLPSIENQAYIPNGSENLFILEKKIGSRGSASRPRSLNGPSFRHQRPPGSRN
jgi:hypothetical protein